MLDQRKEELLKERAELIQDLAEERARMETAKEGLRKAAAKKSLTGKFIHPTEFRQLLQAKERSATEIASIQASISDIKTDLRLLGEEENTGNAATMKALLEEVKKTNDWLKEIVLLLGEGLD